MVSDPNADRPPLTEEEVHRFVRFLSPPASMRDWMDHRDDYPGPYRIPGEQAHLIGAYVRLRQAIRDTARVAPWLRPRGVTI